VTNAEDWRGSTKILTARALSFVALSKTPTVMQQ
jgi:hypothetical protein